MEESLEVRFGESWFDSVFVCLLGLDGWVSD